MTVTYSVLVVYEVGPELEKSATLLRETTLEACMAHARLWARNYPIVHVTITRDP